MSAPQQPWTARPTLNLAPEQTPDHVPVAAGGTCIEDRGDAAAAVSQARRSAPQDA